MLVKLGSTTRVDGPS